MADKKTIVQDKEDLERNILEMITDFDEKHGTDTHVSSKSYDQCFSGVLTGKYVVLEVSV